MCRLKLRTNTVAGNGRLCLDGGPCGTLVTAEGSHVTVTDTVVPSYLATTSIHTGGAAELAETRKEEKYMQLMQSYHFVSLAFETM